MAVVMRRFLRGVVFFFLGVAISFVFMVTAWAKIPAVVAYPNGSYEAQCEAHKASAINSGYCENNAISYSIVSGEYPHKICRLTCNGIFYSDASATANLVCEGGATPYQEGGQWYCEGTANGAFCNAMASLDLPVAGEGGGGSGYVSGTGAMNLCSMGCSVKPADSGRNNQTGAWWAAGPWYYTGAECAPGSPPYTEPETVNPKSPEAECAATGQGWGTVNGTVVCTGKSDATEKTKVSETTGPAGGKTVEKETTRCEGGRCTVTTERTHTGGGASGGKPDGVEITVREGDERSQGAGTGSGSGDGDGDGPKTACDDPLSPECLGAPPEGGEVREEGATVGGVSAVAVASAGCPSAVSLGGYGHFDFAPFCSLAQLIRPAVLALAWLGAALFLVGALRNG